MATEGKVTRRDFIQKTSLTAAAVTTASGLAPSIGAVGANDRINIGVIGCGGIAGHHIKMLGAIKDSDNCAITACCDVYETRMNEYADKVKETFGEAPKKYKDLHELIQDKSLDKILIATPEHQHFQNAMACLEAGQKNIYLEKPMCKTAEESGKLVDAVNKAGAIVQIGVHTASDDVYLAARDYIKEGNIGQVLQAQIAYCRRYGERGPWRTEAKTGDPKPDDLNWKAWLGPAPDREWDARRYFNWRCYWDYSGGIATDLFIHRITRLIKALDIQEPLRGIGQGGIYRWDDGRDIPDNYQMGLEYPGMMVYVLGTMGNKHECQHCVRGYDATLSFEGPGFVVRSQKDENYGEVIHTYERKTDGSDDAFYQGNHINHHAAIRSGDTSNLNCPVSLGHYAVVAVNVANEGYKQKKYMMWDPEKKAIVPAA
jgi:predicted dehydrogenase